MPDFFRDQPRLRLIIGAIITVIVWAMYVVRVTLGFGPMHDYDGNQAPANQYLGGALTVTGIVAVWIVVRAIMTSRQRRNKKPADPQA
jgi:hypothetical protein